MSTDWFYADANGRQIGPVSADELRAALRRGDINGASLVWRDGLAEWTPLSRHADELKLEPSRLPSGPPPVASQAAAASSANPYQAPVASPELWVQAGAGDVVYAGFWRRFAARVLDHFIVFIPIYIVTIIVAGGVGMISRVGSGDTAAGGLVALIYGLPLVANFIYFSTMHSSSHQATLGKMALGIKVTDADGRRLSFGQAATRWFASALSYFTVYIGFIMAGFTDQKRALHDMVASTLVVDKWAYTNTPEQQKRGLSGCLIVFIVVVLLGLFVVPILAAISISQYQDYVIRSQVSEGSALADGIKTAYAEYVANQGRTPTSNFEAGLAAPASIRGQYVSYVDIGERRGSIVVGYSSTSPNMANAALNGKHLQFDATINPASIEWKCRSEDLKQKWCPSSCECGG